jgi:type II secretory pathway pseudopilin PulG
MHSTANCQRIARPGLEENRRGQFTCHAASGECLLVFSLRPPPRPPNSGLPPSSLPFKIQTPPPLPPTAPPPKPSSRDLRPPKWRTRLRLLLLLRPSLWRRRWRPRSATWSRLLLLRLRRHRGCCGCAALCSTTSGAGAGPPPSSRASPTGTPTRPAPTPSSGWARTRRAPPRSSTPAGRSSGTGSRGTPTRSAPPSPRAGEVTSHSSSRLASRPGQLTLASGLPAWFHVPCSCRSPNGGG